MLSKDQTIEIESARLWKTGFKMQRVVSKLMAKYGLDRDEAKDYAVIGRDVASGKLIPDWKKQ